MNPADFGVITTAVASREDAERLASLLLSEKLAACVQIIAVDSHFVWKSMPQRGSEQMLLIKTRAALFDKAMARIAEAHPYEVPELVATPFTAGFAPYLGWIAENTRSD